MTDRNIGYLYIYLYTYLVSCLLCVVGSSLLCAILPCSVLRMETLVLIKYIFIHIWFLVCCVGLVLLHSVILFILDFSGVLSEPYFTTKPPRYVYALNGANATFKWDYDSGNYTMTKVAWGVRWAKPYISYSSGNGSTNSDPKHYSLIKPATFIILNVSPGSDNGGYSCQIEFVNNMVLKKLTDYTILSVTSEYICNLFLKVMGNIKFTCGETHLKKPFSRIFRNVH